MALSKVVATGTRETDLVTYLEIELKSDSYVGLWVSTAWAASRELINYGAGVQSPQKSVTVPALTTAQLKGQVKRSLS